jgi:hypothetical protein
VSEFELMVKGGKIAQQAVETVKQAAQEGRGKDAMRAEVATLILKAITTYFQNSLHDYLATSNLHTECKFWHAELGRRTILTDARYSGGYYSSSAPPGWNAGYLFAPPTYSPSEVPSGRAPPPTPCVVPIGDHHWVTRSHHADEGRLRPAGNDPTGAREIVSASSSGGIRSSANKTPSTIMAEVHTSPKGAGVPITMENARKIRSVHWDGTSAVATVQLDRGILHVKGGPQYNRWLQSTPFTLFVKFRDVQNTIHFHTTRLCANLLLDFEATVTNRFREDCRIGLRQALDHGFCLVFRSRGFKKRIPVYIRGPRAVDPNAAFTGFLNVVPEDASVILEWDEMNSCLGPLKTVIKTWKGCGD